MSKASELIQSHADDLVVQKREVDRWWKAYLVCAILLLLLSVPGAALGLSFEVISFAQIGSVILLFLFMRKGDEARDLEAERLEFERPELYGLDLSDAENDVEAQKTRLSFLGREIVSRKRMRIVRNRARYAEASGIILGSVALTFLVWFGFSIEDFLREYHGGTRYTEAELYEYELEVISIGLIGLVLFGWALTRFRSARSARRELERLEIEHEIMPVEDKPDASRARKLLLINQRNLGSYYAVNKFNSRVSIGVAVLCIIAGICITIWTINAVVASSATEQNSKLVIAAVGAANAIMINVVAAIVLRLQATISSNVNAFHDRLVRSHDIFLANVIAAEIEDDGVRRDTLAAISKAIGLRSKS
ncbi:hypothetical protein [Roseobacter sp.]|uniref:hypothetical protein n=1 Tax=Roseobacter sp. TaxID=1907202 RepID=UPI00385F0C13